MKASGLARIWEVVIAAVCLLVLAAIFFPVFANGHPPRQWVPCISNLKQLSLGLIIYCNDYDDRLPARDGWMEAAEFGLDDIDGQRGALPKSNGYPIEHCPELWKQTGKDPNLFGYAFNSRLSRVKEENIDKPDETPLLYDSINLARNASDPFVSLPVPGRHQGRNVVAFADGHARAIASPAPTR